MKRQLSILGTTLASLLLFASAASAAPTLSVEVIRSPASINRGDEHVDYQVKIANTSASDSTSGTLNASISLPQGFTLKETNGLDWSCNIAALSCTNSTVVPPGGSYPVLRLTEVWIDDSAPDSPTVTVTAGGGSSVGVAGGQDSFTFGPRTPFGLEVTKGIAEDEAGNEETQAGGHPYDAFLFFLMNRRKGPFIHPATGLPSILPIEDLHGGTSNLWPGVIGNPQAVDATCEFADVQDGDCPDAAAVGGVNVFYNLVFGEGPKVDAPLKEVVYRLPHEKGYPASFGFKTIGPAFIIRAHVRSDGDYGVSAFIPDVPMAPVVLGSNFVFCGYGTKVKTFSSEGKSFDGCMKRSDPEANGKALVTLNTNCAAGQPFSQFSVDSWQKRGAVDDYGLADLSDPNWKVSGFYSPQITNCEQLVEEWTGDHEPSFGFQPDSHAADSPAAYTSHVHIPQDGLVDPDGLATSHLKDVKVVLPEGLTFNPAVGHRLEACSKAQIGFRGVGFPEPNPIRFDAKLPHCPEASKIGSLEVKTPVLEDILHGSVFLAAQKENPFGSNYAIYLSVEEPDVGVISKSAGKVSPDPKTGQITVTFTDNPQLPIEDIDLEFFGGDRSALANPVTCGSHQVRTEMTSWSAVDPDHPLSDEIARPGDQIQITSGPHGSKCFSRASERPFDIGYEAGSQNPIAGSHSPFSMRITRPDGSQEIDRLEISPPEGFVGSLKGIPYCSEAQIAAAEHNSGKAEERNPSCPVASQLGTTFSGAGPGANPFYAPGKVYLAGPYKGQTLSVVAVTPAVAGPFDLGNVVIRSALKLDPRTARITAVTDPIPQVFEGIPLRVRDIRINLDRPNWALTPTDCETLSTDLAAYGASGAVAKRSNRYQLGGCENLGFKPKLQIHLKGGTKRGDHPALVAVLSTRPGDANIARAAVTLPPSAFLDQSHIRTICTRVQFAANACPAGAIYGYGKAVTNLLDDPIEGNVYLRSSDNKLPDLVAALKGVANIEAVGRIDSVHGGIRNTFDIVPDAPFEAFTLTMQGGNKGLVVNSQNLCAKDHLATVKLTGQNGRHYNYRPKVIADGCAKGKRGNAKRKRGHHR